VDRQSVERNQRYLVIEIFWAAFFTACTSFNSAFMIHLGGSNFLVSLITSGSALVNAIATMPFAAYVQRTNIPRQKILVHSINVMRLGHLGLIVIPWLAGWRAETMLVLLLILNIPVALFNAVWVPVIGELIPPSRRAKVFFARTITMGSVVTSMTFVLGYWLDAVETPFNYQLMYVLAVITSTLSTLAMTHLVFPETLDPTKRPRAVPNANKTGKGFNLGMIREAYTEHRPFANMVFNTLIFNLGAWMAIPLQPIYFIRTLGASDGWVGWWTGLASGGAIIGCLIWNKVIDKKGPRWVLMRAVILTSLYFFAIGLVPNLWFILVAVFLVGIINPGVDLSHVTVLYEVTPEERRTDYMGLYTTAMHIGTFTAPLLVSPLVAMFGAQTMIIVVGVMRLLGALLFIINPVKSVEAKQTAEP
jgi:MFS family permease